MKKVPIYTAKNRKGWCIIQHFISSALLDYAEARNEKFSIWNFKTQNRFPNSKDSDKSN